MPCTIFTTVGFNRIISISPRIFLQLKFVTLRFLRFVRNDPLAVNYFQLKEVL